MTGGGPSAGSALDRWWRRPETALFALTLGAYAYFYQAGGWNQNARFDLVRAIVERRSLSIDAYHENTGDKALHRGHYYSDKAPGISLLALPVHFAALALRPDLRETDRFQAASSFACTVWSVSLPSAAAVVVLYRLLLAVVRRRSTALALALAYAFGSLAFPYSTLMYGHQTSAAFLLLAFGLLGARRIGGQGAPTAAAVAGAGLLLGLAIATEYPAILGVGSLLAYGLAVVSPRRRLGWLLAGLLAGVTPVLVYNSLAFGAPFTLAYSFSVQGPRHRGFFMGLEAPSASALYYLLLHEYRGLFPGSPWLLLSAPGLLILWRDARLRAAAAVCTAIPLAYLAMNASLTDWHGGWGMGPRHLVPALPFLVLGVGGAARGVAALRRGLRRAVVVTGALGIALSVFLMLVATSVKPEVPRSVLRPFQSFLLPAFVEGRLAVNTQSIDMPTGRGRVQRFAWNLGEWMGLQGHASLLPLAAYVLLVGGWMTWTARLADRTAAPSRVLADGQWAAR